MSVSRSKPLFCATCLVLMLLGAIGCSSDLAPTGASEPVQQTILDEMGTTSSGGSQNGEVVSLATLPPSVAMGGEAVSDEIAFIAVIGGVDTLQNTFQLFNQDDNWRQIIGHVTAETILLNLEGGACLLGDFSVCFSANIIGKIQDENNILLISVAMRPI